MCEQSPRVVSKELATSHTRALGNQSHHCFHELHLKGIAMHRRLYHIHSIVKAFHATMAYISRTNK